MAASDTPSGPIVDDFGQGADPLSDALGQEQSPAGFSPAALPTAKTLSSDEDIKKWRGKGYVFLSNGDVWNANQSRRVGAYDKEALEKELKEGGASDEDIAAAFEGGMTFDKDSGGKESFRSSRSAEGSGRPSAGRAGGSGRTQDPGGAGTAPRPSAPRTPATSTPQSTPQIPGIPGITPGVGVGGGGTGDQSPNPGNISDPGRRGGPSSGVPASLFDFLPANFNQLGPEERMSALIGAVTRRQESGLESGLGRLDQAREQHDTRAGGVRDLEDRILGDTDVMSEADIQRISGKATERANQGANILSQALGDRRASAGSARSGSAQTEQSAVLQNALGTAIGAESDIRAGARRENFASRNQALASVGQSQRADAGVNASLQGAAAGQIEGAQVFGDAFLTQNLLNRGAPQQQPVFRTTQAGGTTIRDRLA